MPSNYPAESGPAASTAGGAHGSPWSKREHTEHTGSHGARGIPRSTRYPMEHVGANRGDLGGDGRPREGTLAGQGGRGAGEEGQEEGGRARKRAGGPRESPGVGRMDGRVVGRAGWASLGKLRSLAL